MVIDVITYNGEKELFDLRYHILKDHVDQFIVVEFDKTFSGNPKNWRFVEDFKGVKFKKVYYHGLEEKDYIKYKELAESSPNTKGAEHWKLEFMQKESIKDALLIHSLDNEDIVFIGDCDEIWNFTFLLPPINDNYLLKPHKLKLLVYTYYLNNLSSEKFAGTLYGKWGDIKNECLNHLRSIPISKWELGADYWPTHGWHFTSMASQLERKLTDSYTEESYATKEVMKNLNSNIANNKDFLGRNFTYKIDEEEWPRYLKDNRAEYLHLLK